jgi:hypothetical protein
MKGELYKAGFVYTFAHLAVDGSVKEEFKIHNLMPNESVNYLLNAAFKGGAQYSTWYVGLFGANRVIQPTDTMILLLADCVEDVIYTTTGNARLTATLSTVVDGALSNVASPNTFAFPAASTVRGAFVTTGVTRGANTGLLASAVLLPSPRVLALGESLKVYVGFELISA